MHALFFTESAAGVVGKSAGVACFSRQAACHALCTGAMMHNAAAGRNVGHC